MSVRTPAAKRLLKRMARHLFVLGSRTLGVGRTGLTVGLRILTYHRVAADQRDPFSVPPDEFARQMEILSTTGAVVSLEKGLGALEHGEENQAQIALTVDDGTDDFRTTVLPILLRFHLPATLYVSPERIGSQGFLGWGDLAQVAKAGIRIGSHGMDHRSLAGLGYSELWHQVSGSRQILEERLGEEVRFMAYPFGTVRDFSPLVKETLRKAGYRSACTSVNGVNRPGVDLLELRRTKIEQGDGVIFKAILAGCLDAWAFLDRHLSVLQNHYV